MTGDPRKITSDKVTQEETARQAAIFSALADPTRLKLVKLLSQQHTPEALCVNALAQRIGITQSAVSQHLRILKNNGLVTGQRRGYYVHYVVNHEGLKHCHNLVSMILKIK